MSFFVDANPAPLTLFTESEKDKMCQSFGLTIIQLRNALRVVGPKGLAEHLRHKWSRDNPCSQFCYRMAEVVTRTNRIPPHFRLVTTKNKQGDSHYFFQERYTGEILDLTADQYPEGYDYTRSKPATLLPQMSEGSLMVVEALGWGGALDG